MSDPNAPTEIQTGEDIPIAMAPVQLEPTPAVVYERTSTFERELADLINRHSEENESGTPGFILARYLVRMLDAFNDTVKERAAWRGEFVDLPALHQLKEGKRNVPMIVYGGNLKMRNEIGEAEIKLTPGEQVGPIGRIEHVIAVFETEEPATKDPMETIEQADKEFQHGTDPATSFQRYQQKGLSE